MSKANEAPNPSAPVTLTQEQLMSLIQAAQGGNGGGFSPEFNKLLERKLREEIEQKENDRNHELRMRADVAKQMLAQRQNEKAIERICTHRKQFGQTAIAGQVIGENRDKMHFICLKCNAQFEGPLDGPYLTEDGRTLDLVLLPLPEAVGR